MSDNRQHLRTRTRTDSSSSSRQQTHDEHSTTEETENENDTTSCPECDGDLIINEGRGERTCSDCGLVIEENRIDHGPEWRAFNQQEKDQKSRVGSPTTKMMHDDGLSTNIDWRDKDARGNSLSSNQRQKMKRLRKWNERFRTRDSQERNLKQALGEIDRMASALGIPDTTRENASVIYRRALNEELLPGRSIEGIATAALYAAARIDEKPRTLDELTTVARVDRQEIRRAYRYIVKELKLEVQPADPMEYLPRFGSNINASNRVEEEARILINHITDAGMHSGKAPTGIAAASLYFGSVLANEDHTQSEIAEECNISEVTIRKRCQELMEEAHITWLTD
ncbi:transcription initiation factor IIB [Salinibaculum rarum]|uniref:transcription initiation factor IIB n=1 Tax=Salinibaculum rarum TaxID=3058903 RepID=UPI00265FDB11|nr:TFIIB-type zinc ribbon-containing protein [Salinibaculum sp. KK48]